MTPRQYWEDDPWLYAAYNESRMLEEERADSHSWLMGLYVYKAIECLAPIFNPFSKLKPDDYISEPLMATASRTQEENDARAEELQHERMASWLMMHGPSEE